MNLCKLYKMSSTRKIQWWEIKVEDNEYWTEHGYVGLKTTVGKRTSCAGKNIGRANETSPAEQAQLEAESKWKKQLDKGYFDSPDKAKYTVVILPMLAHDYTKRGKDITFPCYIQPKLDGIRCLMYWDAKEESVVMMSRKGKHFVGLDHIRTAAHVINWFEAHPNKMLDGELYGHELPFEQISGAVRREKPKPGDEEIEKDVRFNVYDCFNRDIESEAFIYRQKRLTHYFKESGNPISLVKTETLATAETLQEKHDEYVADGYEGIMLRNAEGAYALNKRSVNLQKYKNFQDSEYKITGFEEGRGNAEGTVIWVCTNGKKEFKVRPRGTDAQRREWFQNGSDYVGKELTVRYQELTADDIPRFPVGVAIRDYED